MSVLPTPPPKPVPSDLELLLQRLWGGGGGGVPPKPSREEMSVLEGPGMDFNVDSGPEIPFVVFVDRLNMPGGNFAGVGPVEPSPVLPNTSNPPVPIGVVVSGSNSPIPVFRLLLELSDMSSDIVFRRPRIYFQSWISRHGRPSPKRSGWDSEGPSRLREAPSVPLQSRGVACDYRKRYVQDTGYFRRDLGTCCVG